MHAHAWCEPLTLTLARRQLPHELVDDETERAADEAHAVAEQVEAEEHAVRALADRERI